MQRHTGLVQEENRTLVRISPLHEEDEVEAQEPLKTSAAALKFHFLRSLVVGDPDAKVVTICFKPESVLSLLPPASELTGEQSRGRLKQDAPLLLLLRDGRDFV